MVRVSELTVTDNILALSDLSLFLISIFFCVLSFKKFAFLITRSIILFFNFYFSMILALWLHAWKGNIIFSCFTHGLIHTYEHVCVRFMLLRFSFCCLRFDVGLHSTIKWWEKKITATIWLDTLHDSLVFKSLMIIYFILAFFFLGFHFCVVLLHFPVFWFSSLYQLVDYMFLGYDE